MEICFQISFPGLPSPPCLFTLSSQSTSLPKETFTHNHYLDGKNYSDRGLEGAIKYLVQLLHIGVQYKLK